MANLRMLKKEIDYRLEELVFDCDMAICFQPTKEKEIFEVMQEGVALRNALFVKANNPADAHNPSWCASTLQRCAAKSRLRSANCSKS